MTHKLGLEDVLTEERIADIRSTVLNEIDTEAPDLAPGPGRQRPRWIVWGAAAAITMIVGTGLVASIGSQQGLMVSQSTDDAAVVTNSAGRAPDPGFEVVESADAFDGDSSAVAGEELGESVTEADSTFVITGNIRATASDPAQVASEISQFATAHGGRIDSRYESGDSGSSGAERSSVEMNVRVSPGDVDDLAELVGEHATIEDRRTDSVDVGETVRDVEARIGALEVSVERLESLMADADSTEDLLRIEDMMSARQANLDSLRAQQRGLEDEISLASIWVVVDSEPSVNVGSVEPGGLLGGLATGWNLLISAVNYALTTVGFLLVWAIPVVLVLWTARWLSRRFDRRRQSPHPPA